MIGGRRVSGSGEQDEASVAKDVAASVCQYDHRIDLRMGLWK
jgi:hypothetical protein